MHVDGHKITKDEISEHHDIQCKNDGEYGTLVVGAGFYTFFSVR